MSQNVSTSPTAETGSNFTNCKNCHAHMPSELRFCRNCGFRLGEGSAEYTETVRFDGATAAGRVGTARPTSQSTPFGMGTAGPMARVAAGAIRCRRKRMSGMSWIFVIIVMFFAVGAGASLFAPRNPRRIFPPVVSAPRSYFGVNSFDTADGGVTFDSIEAPGSPADKAGLVGGDIITTFDGQQVTDDGQMMDLLRKTPIGKTVDVVFIRDGETKTTKLTTISESDLDQLGKAFRARPEGRGKFGISNQERVEIPGTKLHGVRLGNVDSSMPADMAGLKSGDIIIALDNAPIRTSAELSYRIQLAVPYKTVVVKIMRGSETMDIPVKVGRQR